jgi:signal transduction histidine kinase/ActR/RegA family two-component response regulator
VPTAAEVHAVSGGRLVARRAWLLALRGGTLQAVVVVTVLAVVDVSAGRKVVLAGLTTVGPCLAAIAGSPRVVAAVGAYSVALLLALSGPDQLWWTRQQLFVLLALLMVTAVCAWAAARGRRDERLLREAEAESARSRAVSEATNQFLSRVSHELRTPLNAMLGFTQLLQRHDLTPDQRETADQVARAGAHLLGLVKDVLDVTATEAGRLSLSVEPVGVGDAVGEALELTASDAGDRGVQMRAHLGPAENWYVLADARRLRQILLNLLSNAVKFNHVGGAVDVSVARDADGNVSIAVSDTGPGIAARDLEKLFQPFERLGAARTGVDGSGLGLALSRGLAGAMGGVLTVASPEGSGATFTVTLPETSLLVVPTPHVSEQAADLARPPRGHASARVLYVEDNLSNLRLVERILELRPAWAVTHAGDGALGLELALATRFDLILLDQDLPELPGLQVLRELRKREDRADVPVVIVSADAAPGHLKRAVAAGATDYLLKPFSIEGLLAILDTYAPPPEADPRDSGPRVRQPTPAR